MLVDSTRRIVSQPERTTGTAQSSVPDGRQEEKARPEPVVLNLFHARAAAAGNERSPRVVRRVGGTSRVDVSADRRRCRVPALMG